MASRPGATQLPFVQAFEQFIHESASGLRRKPDGTKLLSGSVQNYRATLEKIKAFQIECGTDLLLHDHHRLSLKQVERENARWKRFIRRFSEFLRRHNVRSDNYLGFHFKHLKTFLRYLEVAHGWELGNIPRLFFVRKEPVPIVVVPLYRIRSLLQDHGLLQRLSPELRQARDIFLVGCSTGLRVSDLLSLQRSNLEQTGSATYLVIASRKTGSLLRIPLPAYVLEIFRRYRSRGNRLLPHISNSCLNKRLKLLGEAAGWTEPHILWRNRDGRPRMVFKDPTNKTHFRFCDLITSHTMRRSAISMLLASGMAEYLVRKISGHAPNSAEFFRYVDISQDQLDTETLKFYALLEEKPTLK